MSRCDCGCPSAGLKGGSNLCTHCYMGHPCPRNDAMKVITLTDKKTDDKHPHVIETPTFSGNIMGITTVNQIERPFEAILIVDESGEYFAIPVTSGMSDLRRYVESIAGIDIAPYIELAYVDTQTIDSKPGSSFFNPRLEGYKVKLVAWRFHEKRNRARSALQPKSPHPFPE